MPEYTKAIKMGMMYTRYKQEGAKEVPVASIYSLKEHNVRNSQIDKDALWAIRKLHAQGYEAYIVGGAVRDMILGRKPKDFDVATSASPRQVQKMFWNARIIGRRFRIVHLYFNHDKIIEVTTFRSDEENFEEGNNNIFGTIEQDAKRRDFSINSLYYNPQNGQLLDFNSALPDFKKKVIRSLIPLSYSFSEDPVRMIRAVKYSVTTGFRLKWDVKRAIKRNAHHLSSVSTSRLTEEVSKIMLSGHCAEIFPELDKYKLLVYMLPCFSLYMDYDVVRNDLKAVDSYVNANKESGSPIEKSEVLAKLLMHLVIIDKNGGLSPEERAKEAFRQVKVLISPMTPPNYEIERACVIILAGFGFKAKTQRKALAASVARKKPGLSLGRKSAASEELSKTKKVQKKSVKVGNIPQEKEDARTLAESHDF